MINVISYILPYDILYRRPQEWLHYSKFFGDCGLPSSLLKTIIFAETLADYAQLFLGASHQSMSLELYSTLR